MAQSDRDADIDAQDDTLAELAPARRSFTVNGHTIPARPLASGLYIVSTPIGNLGDITLRALETLAAADRLAAEDTRVTRKLLTRYGIARRPVAYHDHNAQAAGPALLETVRADGSVALVSDAGTPLISDPGFTLVREALAQGLPVIPVPGASAAIAALTASGLPADRFLFAGFLPPKTVARRAKLATLAHLDATLVFYEAPQRLAAMLADAAEAFGTERQAAVCRELTKAHETVTTDEIGNLADAFAASPEPKGEIVVVVAPPQDAAPTDAGADAMLNDLAETMSASKAAAEAARLTGLPKGELYKRLLALKGG